MQPDKKRKMHRGKTIARGKMFMNAAMGWIPGFPIGQKDGAVRWISIPDITRSPPAEMLISKEHIRNATYTWNKLVYRFPKALPRIIDNVDRWRFALPYMFRLMKDAIHRNRTLPLSMVSQKDVFPQKTSSLARAVGKKNTDLKPVIDAFSWYLLFAPHDLHKALTWIENHTNVVRVILSNYDAPEDLAHIVVMWRLFRDGGKRRFDGLARHITAPHAFTIASKGAYSFTKSCVSQSRKTLIKLRSSKKKIPQSYQRLDFSNTAEPEFGKALVKFAGWCVTQKKASLTRAMNLMGCLYPTELTTQWHDWLAKRDSCLRQTRRDIISATPDQIKDAFRGIHQLETLLSQMPPRIHIQKIITDIKQLSERQHLKRYKHLYPFLTAVPLIKEDILIRTAIFWKMMDLGRWGDDFSVLLPGIKHFFREYQENPDIISLLEPMLNRWNEDSPNSRWTIIDHIQEEVETGKMGKMVFGCLAKCHIELNLPLDQGMAETIVDMVKIAGDRDTAMGCIAQLVKENKMGAELPEALLKCAFEIDDGQGEFAHVFKALQQIAVGSEELTETLLMTYQHGEHPAWAAFVRASMQDGNTLLLYKAGLYLKAMQALGMTVEKSSTGRLKKTSAWMEYYPDELKTSLTELAGLTPDAEKIAAKILGTDFPNKDKLKTQAEAIGRKLAQQPSDSRLRKRLNNLTARQSAAPAVSADRMARLKHKMERTNRRLALTAWSDGIKTTFVAHMVKALHLPSVPEWLQQSRFLQLIDPIFRLPRAPRNLALRLIRRRCNAPPWNLVDDPRNLRFTSEMKKRGIDMAPWLRPPEPYTATGDNGCKVIVAFENDPLEIFHMGAYFDTCLAPSGFNFFSVFSNAADINKHVIYARREDNKIIGRCLIALTAEGYILTFHPYCHDQDLNFGKIMGALAQNLALKMRTTIALKGTVPALVATSWYDDGPVDLCHRFAFLQPNSSFRKSLAEIKLDQLTDYVQKNFSPLPLNRMTLSLIIDLPELEKRPELILPLLDPIRSCKNFPGEIWLKIASLAHRAGKRRFAYKTLRKRCLRYILSGHQRYDVINQDELRQVLQISPSLCLRIIKQTRPRGVRSDEAETWSRLNIIAEANEALGRKEKAERLWEITEKFRHPNVA